MKKEEILKFIKESNNLKLDLKKALTDESLNFNWIEFLKLYYEYFGEKPWANFEYVEKGKIYQILDISSLSNYEYYIKVNMNENKEIIIYIYSTDVEPYYRNGYDYKNDSGYYYIVKKSTGESVIKNLNLLLEMFEDLNKELNSMDKNVEDFFGESDEVNEVDENEKMEDIDNKLV